MKLMPIGDYYLWYCEWCDSRNLVPWSKVSKNEVCCAACHKKFAAHDEPLVPHGPNTPQQQTVHFS